MCHVYKQCHCIQTRSNGVSYSKNCWFKKFPEHKQARMRQVFGAQLLKSVKVSTQKSYSLYTLYCYLSLKQSLSHFLNHPGFSYLCE